MGISKSCTKSTPSKLVVYKPMGAQRAADRTIAQSCSSCTILQEFMMSQ